METVTQDDDRDGASADIDSDAVGQQRGSRPDTTVDLDRMLRALQDDDCRQLLEATATDSLTATELARECDIPSSTVYRKLERLSDLDLLRESIRIGTDGDHTTEYELAVEAVTISIVNQDGLEFAVSTVQ